MTTSLAGQRALVTGGGTGIGLACARKLGQLGAELLILGSQSAEQGVQELAESGLAATAVTCDLSDVDAARNCASQIVADGGVEILVNNAGIIYRKPATEHSAEGWDRVLAINLDAVWSLSQILGSHMVEQGHGRIITISSLLSFQGGVNVVSYATSKHAVAGMTKALSNEWAQYGVTVNCVAPGYIITANTKALREDSERERAIRERIPAGRWGEPSDIAGAVAFLAGPDAAYISGHTLVVDGGWMGR